MPKVTQISSRKADHIRINLEEDVSSGLTSGLEAYSFIHQALPELNLSEIELSLKLFSKKLAAPILISSMTGGTSQAGEINRILAAAAQETGISMALGSQRAAIEDPELIPTYQVRKYAQDIFGSSAAELRLQH
jgi:isopentenyl-diphosphate delta-isomerase